MATVLQVLFLLAGVILVLLVLIQRGRGGGLAGAFGGPGGHSAFGTKTADVFTQATAVVGAVFFLLSLVSAWYLRPPQAATVEPPSAPAPATPGAGDAEPDQPGTGPAPAPAAPAAPEASAAPAAPADAKAAPGGGAAPAAAGGGAAPAGEKPAPPQAPPAP